MPSLDELADLARSGDSVAEAELFGRLRPQLLRVARRRVDPDDLEDVVQDTVGILHRKHPGRVCAEGTLAWSFSVLRNVIGNYYGARARKPGFQADRDGSRPVLPNVTDPSPDPLARVELEEVVDRLSLGIRKLGESRCGQIFRDLIELRTEVEEIQAPDALADAIRSRFPGLSRNAFYVTLHRCRKKLRAILRDLEGQSV